MGAIFAYSIESSLLLAVMYLTYKWVLSSECQHAFNRLVLWLIYAVALVMPLRGVVRSVMPEAAPAGQVTIEAGMFDPMVIAVDEPAEVSLPAVVMQVLLAVYIAGVVVMALHTVFVALRLSLIIRRGERCVIRGHRVVLIDNEGIAPFSVMNTIVMSRRDFEEAGEMIFEHESNHVRLHHWADLFMAQIVAVLQWYNPAAWLMREEFKSVHEYQADAGVMISGINVKQYQMLLIKKAVGARFPSLANSLNHSKLKKRITMMYNSKTSGVRRLRALALAPALGGAMLLTGIPAVAEAFDLASDATLTVVADKVSENSHDSQASTVEAVGHDSQAEAVVSVAPAESAEQEEMSAAQDADSEARPAPRADETASGGRLGELTVVAYGSSAPKKEKELEGVS